MTNRKLVFLILIFVLGFSSACKTHWAIVHAKTENKIIILDTVNVKLDDVQTNEYIRPYKAVIDSEMNEILAYSEIVMYKDDPEGLLNNFVADLILQKGNEYLKKNYNTTADICLLNSGGLRSALPKGAVTLRNVYELMPFENELVAVQLSGKTIKNILDYIAKKGGMPESGFVMGIKADTAQNILIKNVPFDISKNYIVLTSDYLLAGGDDMTFFADTVASFPVMLKVRDAIIQYLKEQTQNKNTITSKLDKRIYYEK
ncbi:MAG: 5'-nucleotidase [Bacteroidota bacterium]